MSVQRLRIGCVFSVHVVLLCPSHGILRTRPFPLPPNSPRRATPRGPTPLTRQIDEYLTTGAIAESQSILASERFHALRLFSSVWSIGHSTAAELYRAGCRDLEDVRAYFCRTDPEPPIPPDEDGIRDRSAVRAERAKKRRRELGMMTREEVVGTWLELKDELDTKYVWLGQNIALHGRQSRTA